MDLEDPSPGTRSRDWQPFAQRDPFNDTFVEGKIHRGHGDLYGAMLIDRVDGREACRLVLGTPKLAYPLDPRGNWHFPKAVRIERYEKPDGANVLEYVCRDAAGRALVSYKTRLSPFLAQSRFGPFLEMWKEILERTPSIRGASLRLGINLSFEIWGARNPHLIRYEEPLDASLLFGRKPDGALVPPSEIPDAGCPKARMLGVIDRDYVAHYRWAQEEAERGLKGVEDGGFTGREGEVWYVLLADGRWLLFKCKPETIEKIHWSAQGIDSGSLRATVHNAPESSDDPTTEDVVQLLREEYTDHEIEHVRAAIPGLLDRIKDQRLFVLRVLDEYKGLGLDFRSDLSAAMRAMSTRFDRAQMGKVFWVLDKHV